MNTARNNNIAAKTLAFYAKLKKMTGEDAQSQLGDLLGDLMHLSAEREDAPDGTDLDFSAALDTAHEHYREETNEDYENAKAALDAAGYPAGTPRGDIPEKDWHLIKELDRATAAVRRQ